MSLNTKSLSSLLPLLLNTLIFIIEQSFVPFAAKNIKTTRMMYKISEIP